MNAEFVAGDMIEVDRLLFAHWREAVEAALDNPPESVDVLLDLAESLETAWLTS